MKKRIIIWTPEVDDLYLKKGLIGGLSIQMRYWAETFISKGWDVYIPTYNKKRIYNNIHFFKFYNIPKIGTFTEFIFVLCHLLIIKPNLILLRGARRQLGAIALYAKILKIDLVFLGASDVDFKPGEELINNKKDRFIYRFGLRNTDYYILQNNNQRDYLYKNYGNKKNIIIPNIWKLCKNDTTNITRDIDFLWVGNFRELKRPLWFIQLAEENPKYNFVMVGGGTEGNLLYKECEERSNKCNNLKFLGRMDFDDVNKLFEHTRIYICTSTIEGFPNTFLQAWSNNIPIITTFDPSNVVKTNNLGICVDNYEDLKKITSNLIEDISIQQEIKINIAKYFKFSHNTDTMYEKLIRLFEK